VYLAGVESLPTWVNMHKNAAGKTEYNILPLDYDRMDQWGELYGLDTAVSTAAQNSYRRTMLLVYDGLEKAQSWFDEQLAAKFALLG
jgi:hypothetical protein